MSTFLSDIMKGPDAFSVREVIRKGCESTKKHWMKVVMLFVITLGLYIAQIVLAGALNDISAILSAIVLLTAVVAQLFFSIVFLRVLIWSGKEKDFLLSQLLNVKARTLGSYFVAMILFMLMFVLGFILFVIPGVYVVLVYGYAFMLIADKDMGPIEALKASKAMSQPQLFNLFLYACASYGIVYLVLSPLYVLFVVGAGVTTALATRVDEAVLGFALLIPGIILAFVAFIVYIAFLLTFWFGLGHIYHKLVHAR